MGDKINIMDNHLKKINISFSIAILLLITTMIGGGFVFKSNDFFTGKQLSQTINYLNYKLSFAQTNNKNLTASIISIFNDTGSAVKNNNDNAKSIPVLLYHGIIEKPDGVNLLVDHFNDQMFALKNAGWQTVTIDDFYLFMRGEKELPDKSFLLTFDDGRKDSYYPVDPILRALDYNAVIFIITKYSLEDKSNNYYLSKNELKGMSESDRWEIEAHTREGHNIYKIARDGKQGHYYSNKLWLDNENRSETEEEFTNRIKSDFAIAKNDIEQGLGTKVVSFAFPFGDYGQNSINFSDKATPIIEEVVKSFYPISFFQTLEGKGFTFNYPDPAVFMMKRISVKPGWTGVKLLSVLEKGSSNHLPYKETFSDNSGWIKTWGRLTLGNNSMILDSNASTTGSSAFLDGSYLWRDYVFNALVNLIKGQTFSLVARYKDDENYTACNFSSDSVRVEQRLNNKNRVMVEIKNQANLPKNDFSLGIRVNKDKVECVVNGDIVAYSYYVSPALSNGGIGFKTWDPQMNNSELIVKNVSVEEIK